MNRLHRSKVQHNTVSLPCNAKTRTKSRNLFCAAHHFPMRGFIFLQRCIMEGSYSCSYKKQNVRNKAKAHVFRHGRPLIGLHGPIFRERETPPLFSEAAVFFCRPKRAAFLCPFENNAPIKEVNTMDAGSSNNRSTAAPPRSGAARPHARSAPARFR